MKNLFGEQVLPGLSLAVVRRCLCIRSDVRCGDSTMMFKTTAVSVPTETPHEGPVPCVKHIDKLVKLVKVGIHAK